MTTAQGNTKEKSF